MTLDAQHLTMQVNDALARDVPLFYEGQRVATAAFVEQTIALEFKDGSVRLVPKEDIQAMLQQGNEVEGR